LAVSSNSLSAIVGDINNDGKIDLSEAIYALQVASGEYPDVSSSCELDGKGTWVSTSFNECDVVSHNDSYFICNITFIAIRLVAW
jgi:hypothetical protein